jgi:hypothetical protein
MLFMDMEDEQEQYPEGHFLGMWMGIGIALFSGLGIPISIITNNYGFIGMGPAIGVAVGLAIGQGIENKYKQEGRIRPLTEAERKRKKLAVYAAIMLLILGVLVFTYLLFL